MNTTARRIWFLLAGMSTAVAAGSVVLTAWLQLDPCYLCIFQRLLLLVIGLVAFLAAVAVAPGRRQRPVELLAASIIMGLAVIGTAVATYQSWLQWQPADTASCVSGQPNVIEQLVEWLGEWLPSLFLATGFCEDRALVILGLSLANWAGILFLGILLITIRELIRVYHH